MAHQYFLGDDLLVAPVTQPGARSWQLYLPAGRWVDVSSGVEHGGGAIIERSVPFEEIPVYVRASRAPDLLPVFLNATGLA